MNLQTEMTQRLSTGIARKINELIEEALCKRLNLDSVNVLDYKDRMAKTPWSGGHIISLDAEPILYLELVANEQLTPNGPAQNVQFGMTIKWRFFEGSVK